MLPTRSGATAFIISDAMLSILAPFMAGAMFPILEESESCIPRDVIPPVGMELVAMVSRAMSLICAFMASGNAQANMADDSLRSSVIFFICDFFLSWLV